MIKTSSYGTLSEFLLQAGTEYLVIDVSRTRQIIDNQVLFDCELNKIPFPTPRQGHAWLCVVFWNKQINQEHYIWFVKLPVDEQSLLMQAARDQFLHIVVTALGKELEQMESQQAELPENPFVFAPNQQQLADCNATIRHSLKLPHRAEIKAAVNYLKAPNVQPWDSLAVQDISDLALQMTRAQTDEEAQASVAEALQQEIEHAFNQNIEVLPSPVCVCLFSTLEGCRISESSIDCLLDYHSRCESSLAPMVLRALASSQTHKVRDYIHSLISNEQSLDLETLVVIAGRHWQLLVPDVNSKHDYLTLYFEKVIRSDTSYALFRGVFADLVQLPQLRVFVLAMLRSQTQSDNLNKAIASLFDHKAGA
jgi:hypothetical protein